MRDTILTLFVVVLLVGCSQGNAGEQANPSENEGASETSESSLFCCTLRESCIACGCNTAETQIVESGVESACKQLLDSSDYRCAVSDETTALAKCVSGSSTPSSSEDLNRCLKWGDNGCVCRDTRYDDDVPFPGVCDEASVGVRGLCCQGEGYCNCEAVLCGISASNGFCLCGVGVGFETLVASCDGAAGTCCTQDTGYCYCEDGCEQRFSSRIVTTCNQNTTAATCEENEIQVTSCQR